MNRLVAIAVALPLVALAACSGDPGDAASPTSPAESTSPSVSASPAPGTTDAGTPAPGTADPATAPTPPSTRTCYRLRFDELAEPTSDNAPVPCTDRHNAQTIHVGQLDTVVDGHLVAVDSQTVQQQIAEECPRRLAAHIGGSRSERALSRLHVVWFSPTVAESDAGADWFRCDLVALSGPEALAALPAPRRLAGVLDRRGGLDRYGLCGTAAPGAASFERVICSRPHSWRAVSTIRIDGGRTYPGAGAVRRAGDETCRDRVRRAEGSPMRFRYGWEWPTKEQWARGQRFGYCWAPD